MSDLTKFNLQCENLINDLIKILPDEKDLKVAYEQFSFLKSANAEFALRGFLKYVYPCKDHIMNKDEEFFLGNGVNQEVNKFISNEKINNDYAIDKVLNLKNFWKSKLSNDDKEVIWKYFQVLIVLCERYVSKKM